MPRYTIIITTTFSTDEEYEEAVRFGEEEVNRFISNLNEPGEVKNFVTALRMIRVPDDE